MLPCSTKAPVTLRSKFYIPELTRCENNPTKPITIAMLNKSIVSGPHTDHTPFLE